MGQRLGDVSPTRRRPALVADLRRAILADARRRVAQGRLEGPAREVTCSIAREDQVYAKENPGAPILRYSCLAVRLRSNGRPPVMLGAPFAARVQFEVPRYTWCMFTPVGGEGTHTALTFEVSPSPKCVAPPEAG